MSQPFSSVPGVRTERTSRCRKRNARKGVNAATAKTLKKQCCYRYPFTGGMRTRKKHVFCGGIRERSGSHSQIWTSLPL